MEICRLQIGKNVKNYQRKINIWVNKNNKKKTRDKQRETEKKRLTKRTMDVVLFFVRNQTKFIDL